MVGRETREGGEITPQEITLSQTLLWRRIHMNRFSLITKIKASSLFHLFQHSYWWNLYKATTAFCGISRQMVFHDRENKHDYAKTVPGKFKRNCVLVTFPQSHYTGFTVFSIQRHLAPVSCVAIYCAELADGGICPVRLWDRYVDDTMVCGWHYAMWHQFVKCWVT